MQRLDNAEQAAKREAELRLERISLNEMEATSWSAGWEKALREFSKNAENYGKAGEAAFSSVVGNMNSAIDNFVRTGKFSFKDLAKSIIQDLIAIQLKAQAAFLFQRAMSSFGFTMKAGGGAVSQNIPYLVGENGPELFVPQTGGAIIPNERMSGAGGIGGQTINYNGPYIQNMSAIDTQTATQFLAKNKMAVWSANQSATRSLPQSR
jgi:phage-related minor tail protein